ncbi:hypothetical protein RYH80_17650 [Halobaculum sp. MBLA0147]|uniref:DUF7510 family protein n=1 Tax=Halobaculum sp. MBLA0147 TaxID=3079934 RepID=UPI00352455A6
MTDDEAVSYEVRIDDGRTVIDVHGDRAVAAVVWADGDQRIYLPPEGFDEDPAGRTGVYGGPDDATGQGDSPYDGPRSAASPYESAVVDDSAYQRTGDTSDETGVHTTADGFRIVHPAPVDDCRLLR